MSRRLFALAVVTTIVAAAPALAAPGETPDVKSILAHHVQARGGAERWAKVRSLELHGTWEAFSTPGPFTAYYLAPDHWRFEHVLFGSPAVLGYDGEHTWFQGAALGAPEPTLLGEDQAWRRNLVVDAPLRTPLLTGPGAGVEIELVGRQDVEGTATWALRVKQPDLPEETWYLDAATYLELKRDSMTFDVFSGGIEIPMETYWDDFREVEGLILPFHEERHFGTRYHVTDVESVKVNPALESALFTAPPPPPPPQPEETGDAAGTGL